MRKSFLCTNALGFGPLGSHEIGGSIYTLQMLGLNVKIQSIASAFCFKVQILKLISLVD